MKLEEFRAYKRLSISPVAAEGNELVLADGRRVLDLYGGHCVNTLGAGDDAVGETIQRQWKRLSFATNLLDHAPRRDFQNAFAANLPAREFSLAVSALDCATRGAPDAALARQAAMYLAHVVFALSFAAVGRIFGRDRTTVAHACSVIENLRDDPRFDARMTALENICRTIGGAE